MIDSKAVAQEVQKELLAVLQRGQDQVRKGQDRVRKSQEQVRKSRAAVTGAVTEVAKSVLPAVPTRPGVHVPTPAELRAHAQELASQALTAQRDLAGKARQAAGPYAERVIAAQRELARQTGLTEHVAAAQRSVAGKVIEAAKVATPFVAEGRARLTQVVGVLRDARKPGQRAAAAPETEADQATPTGGPKLSVVSEPAADDAPAAAAKPNAAKPNAAKPKTAKPQTTKASASRSTGTRKPGTTAKK